MRVQGKSRGEATRLAQTWLRRVGLAEFASSYPHQLSTGMRRRALPAATLVTELPVILMDEPFAHVDALTSEHLADELLRLWRQSDSTVLFVTHDVREAVALADLVIVLTSRPCRVRGQVDVPIPRPRSVQTMHHHGYYAHRCDEVRRMLTMEEDQ